MNIRIYQINMERGMQAAFLDFDAMLRIMAWKEVDNSIYDLVYEGDVGTENPEEIYSIFNTAHPKNFTGRALSVSDIVEIDGEFLFCDSIGFRKISFMPPVRMIRGFLLDVENGVAEERTVPDKLDSYYKMLNCSCIDITIRKLGYSGNRYFEFVVDDEGMFKTEPIISAVDNYGRGMFVGNLFITGRTDEEGNLTSLTDKDVNYIKRFLMLEGTERHPEPHIMLDQVEYAR